MSSVYTLKEAQEYLKMWMAAEKAVAVGGKKYKVGNRELERADLKYIAERIEYWKKAILQIKRGSYRPKTVSVIFKD